MISKTLIVSLTLAGAVSFVTAALADHPRNFRAAKKEAIKIYDDYKFTSYCACEYNYVGKKLVPDPKKCGYEPRNARTKSGKPNARATRIEWEHVMPAWVFGHQMQCWQKGGRRECKKDIKFSRMESDLHNLVPAVGELNGDRSNYRMTEIPGEMRVYGACDFEVDFKERKAEPPDWFKGDVARIYFYMAHRYGLKLSKQQVRLFEAWAKQDPVSQWERIKDERVEKVQGNSNPFIQ